MKEEAKEIVQAVTEAAKDRIKNPVMATFVISWCVFNWSSLLVLVFGKESIQQKVQIASVAFSDIGSWLIPIFFTASYLFLNKPLNLVFQKAMVWFDYMSMSIEHNKKIKDLELEKARESLRAEKDMTYEDTKTNKEKEIQEMREQITVSKDNEGALTKELDELKKNKIVLEDSEKELKNTKNNLENKIKDLTTKNSDYTIEITALKNELFNSLEELQRANSFSENITHDHSKLTEENKNLAKENTSLQQRVITLENLAGSLEGQIENYKNKISLQTPRFGGIGLGSLAGTNELNKEINNKNINASSSLPINWEGGLGGIGEVDKKMNKKGIITVPYPNSPKKD
ncbi:hypothetical protein ACY2L5_001206 [Providencia rettgeri]|nr:hypothetical protein [Providencia sp. PROV230]